MSKIKGKQIQDNSLDLEKLRSGSKLLPDISTLGTNKDISEITNPKEFTSKEYVDDAVASSTVLDVWLEKSGYSLSSTSGIVTYLGSFTYPSNAISNADVYINGVKLRKSEYYFDTLNNHKPITTSVLYFNLNNLPYIIDTNDYVEIKYLSNDYDDSTINTYLPYGLPLVLYSFPENDDNFLPSDLPIDL